MGACPEVSGLFVTGFVITKEGKVQSHHASAGKRQNQINELTAGKVVAKHKRDGINRIPPLTASSIVDPRVARGRSRAANTWKTPILLHSVGSGPAVRNSLGDAG